MGRHGRYAMAGAILWIVSGLAQGETLDEAELARAYGAENMVSIATGSQQPVTRAPAVATLITAEDIRAIGATDLDQVLATVPGLHVSRSGNGNNPIYVIRGIYSEYNPQVLVLINGIPITNVFAGNRSQAWGGMPVANIARIEVIRGPGSALYGADAFAGVINVITKKATEIAGSEFGLRAGRFSSYDAWVQHGGRLGPAEAAISLEMGKTDGWNSIVRADALSGTPASLAPGPYNARAEYIEARFDLAYDKWRLRGGYQGRRDLGTGAGAAQALDPAGHSEGDRYNADLTYDNPRLTQDWSLTAQLSYFDVATRSDLVLFPKGAFGGAFPAGMIGNPYVYERHGRGGLSAFYTGFSGHKIRLGAGLSYDSLYRVQETKNFVQTAQGNIIPLGEVVDVSDSAPFVRTGSRKVAYSYAQDEWNFRPDWTLTTGLRYDHYSDIGQTVNPRMALVWDAAYNLTTKLLYGRAFRAPSFQELYNINNPSALGNPNLKPETIQTVELAFAYQPTGAVGLGLNIFRYQIRDLLRFVADPAPATSQTARNAGELTGHGLELEAKWRISQGLRLSGSYALQRSSDGGVDAGNAPRHQIYGRADWQFAPSWAANLQTKWISERKRTLGDSRADLPGYTTVDLTLRRERLWNDKWTLGVSVRNVFNADVREPSPAPGLIPDDLPLAGRSWYVELRGTL
jgi:outer membrane receptor for ferrienterochelin and colicins